MFVGKQTITLALNSQSENDNWQIFLQNRNLHKLTEVGNYIWTENQIWQSHRGRQIHGDGPLPWPRCDYLGCRKRHFFQGLFEGGARNCRRYRATRERRTSDDSAPFVGGVDRVFDCKV
jgi:hypothetical protein